MLADLISTNHTYFFREPAHFDFLRTDVLPEIEASLTRGGDNDLRLWCAAASTGEEAYTIVMTMLDSFGPRYACFNAGLLATDLSLKALRQAAAGVYSREQVQRVPPGLRQRYFLPQADGRLAVATPVRAEVLFRQFNLVTGNFAFKKPFHAIFCRNVMIYLDPPAPAGWCRRCTRPRRRAATCLSATPRRSHRTSPATAPFALPCTSDRRYSDAARH